MGQNWPQKIRLDWQVIHQLQQIPPIQETLKRYAEVFESELVSELSGVVVSKSSAVEIIVKSNDQIVPLKVQKCCTIFTRPPFLSEG